MRVLFTRRWEEDNYTLRLWSVSVFKRNSETTTVSRIGLHLFIFWIDVKENEFRFSIFEHNADAGFRNRCPGRLLVLFWMLTERDTCWTRRCRHSQERGNGPLERTFQPRRCRPPPPCDISSLLVSLQKLSWVLRVLLLDKGVTSSALLLELVCCRVGHTDFYLKRFALQFMHIDKRLPHETT